LEVLLDYGAASCVNSQDFEGATPLHIAGDSENGDIIEALIEKGADPDKRNNFGVKAGELCMNRGHEEALMVLERAKHKGSVVPA
jgi:ankyrin repeat protein